MKPSQPTKIGLWGQLYPLWMQYCGMADEYHAIEDKWSFLNAQGSGRNAFLPVIPGTFGAVNNLVDFAGDLFETFFGFTRTKEPDFATFDAHLGLFGERIKARGLDDGEMNPFYLHEQLSTSIVPSLGKYISILRECFNQRTSSDEIPEHIARFSHNVERTFGNELMLAAADKLTRDYVSSMTDAAGLYEILGWDGVVSLSYATVPSFAGAQIYESSLTRTYHISLAEEAKYFPGACAFVAHELGHVLLSLITPDEKLTKAPWYLILRTELESTSEGRFLTTLKTWDGYLLEQCVCDTLATYVAGPAPVYAVVDLNPSIHTVFRVAFVRGFFHNDPDLGSIIQKELNSAKEQAFSTYPKEFEEIVQYVRLGSRLGEFFWDGQVHLTSKAPKFFPEIPFAESLDKMGLPRSSEPKDLLSLLFPHSRYTTDKTRDEEIIGRLEKRMPLVDVLPRYVMHGYYTLYRRRLASGEGERKPPSYSDTIHSLAYGKA